MMGLRVVVLYALAAQLAARAAAPAGRGRGGAPQPGARRTFNVLDFGAVGDGVHNDTQGVQAAMDAAAAAGGTTEVFLPGGHVYLA